MKKLFLFSFLLFTSSFLLLAQAPQGIPYQAIARNANGAAIANTAVKVRFSIRDSIATGAIKYQETHNPTTSALGLFSVNVGMGTVVSGTFSGINWGKNAKFLQVEMDPAGGTTYTDLGTTQMMSVPYALYSKSSDAIKMRTSASGDTLYTGGGNYVIIPGVSAANTPSNWNGSILTDIDGNTYQTVTIGNQIWMKENLKVNRYRNGDPIPTNLSDANWSSTTSGAYSIFNNDVVNNTTYGKLYNGFAVKDQRGLCPAGWHIPTDSEMYALENYLDPTINNPNSTTYRGTVVGGKMKAVSGLWISPNSGATNSSGFTGLPGSYRRADGIYYFAGIGNDFVFWSSTENNQTDLWFRGLYSYGAGSYRGSQPKNYGNSVRCLKD
jgi:uncharacterized protein (TIGR02145 family)